MSDMVISLLLTVGGRTDQSADSKEISAVRASICAFCGSRNHDNDIIRMLKERRV